MAALLIAKMAVATERDVVLRLDPPANSLPRQVDDCPS